MLFSYIHSKKRHILKIKNNLLYHISLPPCFLFMDSILPLYFSLYPDLQELQQKNRSISANFKTLGLSEIGPLQKSQTIFIVSPLVMLFLILSVSILRISSLISISFSSYFVTSFLIPCI